MKTESLLIIAVTVMIAVACGTARQVVDQDGVREYGEVEDVTVSYGGTQIDANGYAVKKMTTNPLLGSMSIRDGRGFFPIVGRLLGQFSGF